MKKFVLVWLYNGKPIVVCEGIAQLCQRRKSELLKVPSYRHGKLILRTAEGFKANPTWSGKSTGSKKAAA